MDKAQVISALQSSGEADYDSVSPSIPNERDGQLRSAHRREKR